MDGGFFLHLLMLEGLMGKLPWTSFVWALISFMKALAWQCGHPRSTPTLNITTLRVNSISTRMGRWYRHSDIAETFLPLAKALIKNFQGREYSAPSSLNQGSWLEWHCFKGNFKVNLILKAGVYSCIWYFIKPCDVLFKNPWIWGLKWGAPNPGKKFSKNKSIHPGYSLDEQPQLIHGHKELEISGEYVLQRTSDFKKQV